jgi:Protein ChrB, N-terminal
MNAGAPRTLAHSWLLLIHQLPAKPAYLRVKIWRRLQDLGAIAVKNAVHALPMNEETQEDFEWLLREIVEGGGEAFLCEARLIDGFSDEEVRALFDRARDADYEEIAKTARVLAKSLRPQRKIRGHRRASRTDRATAQTSRRGGVGRFLRSDWSRNRGRLGQRSRGPIEQGRGRDGQSDR